MFSRPADEFGVQALSTALRSRPISSLPSGFSKGLKPTPSSTISNWAVWLSTAHFSRVIGAHSDDNDGHATITTIRTGSTTASEFGCPSSARVIGLI
jgi:hypothetical protein